MPAASPDLVGHLARIRKKAEAVRRERYAQRLRERLKGLETPGQIWRAAYLAGFRACHQGWLNRTRRGEVIVVKERRVRDWNAA
jgi:hypothetical protein